jgi:phosphoglycerate dehydrogenase-like enzyme
MRLLIVDPDPSAYLNLLKDVPTLQIANVDAATDLASIAEPCDIWLGSPDLMADLLREGLRPRWAQSTWAGIKPLLDEELPRDYVLSRAVGVFGQVIGEYALTYMLAHERSLLSRLQSQAHRRWDNALPGTLAGRCVLIVGAGDIGTTIGTMLKAFGCEVLGISRQVRPNEMMDEVGGMGRLSELAERADYVINLLPDTPHTRDVYDEGFFSRMKASGVFINAGRGTAVVDADLIAALGNGELAGAVLDVFREEPLPADHPFWSTRGLIITGHVAGPTLGPLMVNLFRENLQRWQCGKPLRGQVDFERGY